MEGGLITEKFNQWINGKGEKEARISIFNHIRDIPYAIVPKLRDYKTGPSGMLELNKGSCQPKHFLLALLFDKLNIQVKYVTYPFRWQEQPLKYTEDLKKNSSGLPTAYHLACKAYIENKWVLVDATYDLTLKRAGFPVNEHWGGTSDAKNAVIPLKEVIHENLKERVDYELAQRSRYAEEEKMLYADFVDKFNLWLESIRKT